MTMADQKQRFVVLTHRAGPYPSGLAHVAVPWYEPVGVASLHMLDHYAVTESGKSYHAVPDEPVGRFQIDVPDMAQMWRWFGPSNPPTVSGTTVHLQSRTEAVPERTGHQAHPAQSARVPDPDPVSQIAQALDASRWMLSLEDDWDDQGSPAYSEETWQRAAGFLLGAAQRLWDERHVTIPAPAVHNGPEGTIDIQWVTGTRTLLINIPTDPGDPVPFYGHDDKGHEINGTLDAAGPASWLLAWLVE